MDLQASAAAKGPIEVYDGIETTAEINMHTETMADMDVYRFG